MSSKPHLAHYALAAFRSARERMPTDQITIRVITAGMDDESGADLTQIYGAARVGDAASWALAQRSAADLPVESVVAFPGSIRIKAAANLWPGITTTGVQCAGDLDDEAVDLEVAAGNAVVLRVGAGEAS